MVNFNLFLLILQQLQCQLLFLYLNLNLATFQMAKYVHIALNVLVTSVNKVSAVPNHPVIKLHSFQRFKEIIVLAKNAHLIPIVKVDIVQHKIHKMYAN